jgi:hypothetical protein
MRAIRSPSYNGRINTFNGERKSAKYPKFDIAAAHVLDRSDSALLPTLLSDIKTIYVSCFCVAVCT